jgi:hypothetical protein
LLRKIVLSLTVVLALSLIAGCGPSPGEIATMTAAAWTATPMPTATATPVPYDLTVNIVDADGNAVSGASVSLAELDADDMSVQVADESGQVAWTNLPGEMASLSVQAQGFLLNETAQSLERGSNEILISLERDPFGLLASESCLPGENLQYLEDFQDMQAQNWDAFEMNMGGWSIEDLGDGNRVFVADESAGGATLNGLRFDNAVWRLRFRYDGGANPNFEWRVIEDSSYQIGIITADIGGGSMQRAQGPAMNTAGSWNFHPFVNEWYYLEISYFDGEINVYINGSSIMRPYQESESWGPGMIRITPFMNPGSRILLDNFVVCELTQPFETSFVEPSE